MTDKLYTQSDLGAQSSEGGKGIGKQSFTFEDCGITDETRAKLGLPCPPDRYAQSELDAVEKYNTHYRARYTQSDMDRELSAFRERCAKVVTEIAAFTRKTANEIPASASDKRSAEAVAQLLDQLTINIKHIPITPHTEEGTR